jgi:hypothetical protein
VVRDFVAQAREAGVLDRAVPQRNVLQLARHRNQGGDPSRRLNTKLVIVQREVHELSEGGRALKTVEARVDSCEESDVRFRHIQIL